MPSDDDDDDDNEFVNCSALFGWSSGEELKKCVDWTGRPIKRYISPNKGHTIQYNAKLYPKNTMQYPSRSKKVHTMNQCRRMYLYNSLKYRQYNTMQFNVIHTQNTNKVGGLVDNF